MVAPNQEKPPAEVAAHDAIDEQMQLWGFDRVVHHSMYAHLSLNGLAPVANGIFIDTHKPVKPAGALVEPKPFAYLQKLLASPAEDVGFMTPVIAKKLGDAGEAYHLRGDAKSMDAAMKDVMGQTGCASADEVQSRLVNCLKRIGARAALAELSSLGNGKKERL